MSWSISILHFSDLRNRRPLACNNSLVNQQEYHTSLDSSWCLTWQASKMYPSLLSPAKNKVIIKNTKANGLMNIEPEAANKLFLSLFYLSVDNVTMLTWETKKNDMYVLSKSYRTNEQDKSFTTNHQWMHSKFTFLPNVCMSFDIRITTKREEL